jgi:hypothetical protein
LKQFANEITLLLTAAESIPEVLIRQMSFCYFFECACFSLYRDRRLLFLSVACLFIRQYGFPPDRIRFQDGCLEYGVPLFTPLPVDRILPDCLLFDPDILSIKRPPS